MARIRSIKPEFFTSTRIADLSDAAKVTFLGLLTEADDYGVAPADPRVLKGHIWPLGDHINAADVELHLKEMETGKPLIERYTVDDKQYLLVIGFAEHQKVQKPSQKRHPRPPTDTDQAGSPPVALPEPSCSPTGAHAEGYAEEVEVEVEVDREQSSSSGPVHQQISTGPDDDDHPKPPDPPPPAPPHEARAREASRILGVKDSMAASAAGVSIGAFAPHARSCAETRWAVMGPDLIALAEAHPHHDSHALALLAHDQELASATSGAPPGHPPARARPLTWSCPTCAGLTAHDTGRCELAWLADIDPVDLDELDRRALDEINAARERWAAGP